MKRSCWFLLSVILHAFAAPLYADTPTTSPDLRVGTGFHAFEHLGGIGHQAEAAAACGVTVIYASGVGGDGYGGLPETAAWKQRLADEAAYAKKAHDLGITTVLGYLCATSIVGLEAFDAHWTDAMRAEFGSAPETWLQQDANGNALPSWYGGEYRPACMNNPSWRNYETYMVRQQLETGHDGVFFDNPTVHIEGCYCTHCMAGFAAFMKTEGTVVPDPSVEAMRKIAQERVNDFKRYRCTIGRDFLAAMRAFARTINPKALITANNSLNSPEAMYSQSRGFAYNIYEMSKGEDFVVVEDMSTQPRTNDDGTIAEYGPTYAQLHAISHGLPLVAVTIVDGEYHTPPNLVRLAMAEAAAHEAMYMLWSAWPEAERERMIRSVRPYADWQRKHADLLNDSERRRDVQLFLPFRRWVDTEKCIASTLAGALSAGNIQYAVFSEDDFTMDQLRKSPVVLVEAMEALTDSERQILEPYGAVGGHVVDASKPNWMHELKAVLQPSVRVDGPPQVRAVARDQETRTVVHVMNLNVTRVDPFHDVVTPAEHVKLEVATPFEEIGAVRYATPDGDGEFVEFEHTRMPAETGTRIRCTIPTLAVSGILVIEHAG